MDTQTDKQNNVYHFLVTLTATRNVMVEVTATSVGEAARIADDVAFDADAEQESLLRRFTVILGPEAGSVVELRSDFDTNEEHYVANIRRMVP